MHTNSHGISRVAVSVAAILCTAPAFAHKPTEPVNEPAAVRRNPVAHGVPERGICCLQGDYATGDWGGRRTALSDRGLDITIGYTVDVFGNVSGGFRQGVAWNGLLELGLDFDFEKQLGIKGLTAHINGFLPSGKSFTSHYGGDFGTVTNLEFYNSARLFEAWFQQEFLDGKISIRAGALALDEEFAGSDYAALFINASFGADTAMSANMPVPIYAIAAPGVRLKLQPTDALYIQGAIYDGNPAPGFFGDPSIGAAASDEFNRHGTDWAVRDDEGSLWIIEAGYVVNPPNEKESAPDGKATTVPKAARGLFGSYKIGYAHHSDSFADFHAAARGVLRNKSSNSVAYGLIDQEILREAGTEGQGLGFFARAMFAPDSQNTVDYAFEVGLRYQGILPGRDEDTLGLGYAHISISDDFARANLAPRIPKLDHEGIIELTYSAKLTPWLSVQPDLQYIIHPGASNALSDEWAVGLRASLAF